MMKFKHLIPALCLCLLLLAVPAAAAGGAGTAVNPYVIQTPAELQSIQNDLSASYILGNDIDMSGYTFTPIGSTAAPFFGSLDGKGHTISNLIIDRSYGNYVGLFCAITGGASIKNLNFKDCTISGNTFTGTLCGTVLGLSTPFEIDNIGVVNCTVSSVSTNCGGIAGVISGSEGVGTLSNSHIISCDISTTQSNMAGGIAGAISGSEIIISDCVVERCYIHTGSSHIGGICGSLVGVVSNNIIKDCVIAANSDLVGGICSSSGSYTSINDNLVDGCVITLNNMGGGIVGRIQSSSQTFLNNNSVEDCSLKVRGSYAGGIAGCSYARGQGSISGCSVANTTVQASSYASGICPTFTR